MRFALLIVIALAACSPDLSTEYDHSTATCVERLTRDGQQYIWQECTDANGNVDVFVYCSMEKSPSKIMIRHGYCQEIEDGAHTPDYSVGADSPNPEEELRNMRRTLRAQRYE